MADKLNKKKFKVGVSSIYIISAFTILLFLILFSNYLLEIFIACKTILLISFAFKNAKYLTFFIAAFIAASMDCHQTYISDLIFTSKIFVVADSVASAPSAIEDDLLDARCQSKCLYELEKSHKNNTEIRKQLKHHITSICKNDSKCSSCILPCHETRLDFTMCVNNLCKNSLDYFVCENSCKFLDEIRRNKPGACPLLSDISNLECSATCDNDIDCGETQKCCTSGCSRSCRLPLIFDNRLLPVPEGITIQERKRKRSAIVRWIMKLMSPMHIGTNSNLFVVQWRWGVHQHDDTMTPWQTITVRNKMYTILKHVLAPGRYYSFRVAAVNIHGSYGFSKPSQPPFKLSRSVKAPSPPLNLKLVSMRWDSSTKKLIPLISWQPPRSDLPLKDYQLSWWKVSLSPENNLFKKKINNKKRSHRHSSLLTDAKLKQRRNHEIGGEPNLEEYENDDDFVEYENLNESTAIQLLKQHSGTNKGKKNGSTQRWRPFYGVNSSDNRQDFHSIILPSYSTETELNVMSPDETYAIELYASIESSEGELRGEPAVIEILLNSTSDLIKKSTISSFSNTILEKFSNRGSNNLFKTTSNLPIILTDNNSVVVDSKIYENTKPSLILLYDSTDVKKNILKQKENKFKQKHELLFGESLNITILNDDSFKNLMETTESLLLKNNTQLVDKNLYSNWRYQHQHQGVELKTPYYEHGHLKTALSWLHHPLCQAQQGVIIDSNGKSLPRFRVRIHSSGCVNELPPQEFHVDFCVANFENLQFQCEYFVEVSSLKTHQSVTKIRFTTAPCEKTPSTVSLQCFSLPKRPNFDNNQPENESNNINELLSTTLTPLSTTTTSSLATEKLTVNLTEMPKLSSSTSKILTTSMKESITIVNCISQDSIVAECSWKKLNNNEDSNDVSLIGYRIILEVQDNQLNNIENTNQVLNTDLSNKQQRQRKFISVVGAEERRVLLQSLLPETHYRFRVQPLTVHGLSTDLYETFFNTKSIKQSKNELKNHLQSYNTNRNKDELTHSIIENSLDSLSLSTSFGTRSLFNLPIVCILIILTLIVN